MKNNDTIHIYYDKNSITELSYFIYLPEKYKSIWVNSIDNLIEDYNLYYFRKNDIEEIISDYTSLKLVATINYKPTLENVKKYNPPDRDWETSFKEV